MAQREDRAKAEQIAPAELESWASAAQSGDPDAFEKLVIALAPRVFGLVLRIVRQREEAEDLTQEAFLRAYRHLVHYDPRRPFHTWMFAIAARVALNGVRSRIRRGARVASGDAGARPEHWENTPDMRAAPTGGDHALRQERLEAAIAQLSPREAALIQLHYREEMSLQEAGKVLGLKAGAAKVALFRARQRLRQLLSETEEP